MATSTTSILPSTLNSPQAVDDNFLLTDLAGSGSAATGLTETDRYITVSGDTITLDVLANDLGGNAKRLVDAVFGTEKDSKSSTTTLNDLITADSTANTDQNFGSVTVSGGKLQFTMNAALKAEVDRLPAGVTKDVFITYSIQLSNGTFSLAEAKITFAGTNDGATITGTATGGVTEDGEVQTTGGTLAVSDIDDGQAKFQTPASLETAYGDFAFNPDTGVWSFTLDNDAAQSLAKGEKTTVSLNVTSLDGTASQTITVTITGTNDAPTITSAVDAGDVAEDGTQTASGQIVAADVDNGAELSFAAALTDGDDLGTFDIDDEGNWTFTLDNDAVQSLAEDEETTVTYTVTVSDGKGGSVTQNVTITITGTNDLPVVTAPEAVLVDENGSTDGQLAATDTDGDTLTFSVEGDSKPPAGFTLDEDGSWSFEPTGFDSLGEGDSQTFNVSVIANDGHGNSEAQILSLTVTGSNDAATISGTNSGTIGEDDTGTTGGTLSVSDLDSGEAVFRDVASDALVTPYGTFSFDEGTGAWSFDPDNSAAQALGAGKTATATLDVVSADGTDSETITVTINGANDAAQIGGTSTGSVTEDGTLTSSGTLSITDADTGEAAFQSQTNSSGTYGTFSINASGAWSYTLNNSATNVQALTSASAPVETFTVTSVGGTTFDVKITVNGANEPVTLTPAPAVTADQPTTDPNNNDGSGSILSTTLNGGTGQTADTLYGGGGADTLNGNGGNDKLYGGSGGDVISGGQGNDTLYGGSGSDTIAGGSGDDTIYGGTGADSVTGDAGNDQFIFLTANDRGDVITDFTTPGDKINVSSIDANTATGGSQIFAWGGTTATANGLWYLDNGDGTSTFYGDTNGTTDTAEFWFTVNGTSFSYSNGVLS